MANPIRDSSNELPENYDINVTPFIDVILVLLVIFMVAAPLATVDTPVDLPSSTATPISRPDRPLFLTITRDGRLILGDTEVSAGTLSTTLDAESRQNRDQRIFLRADKTVDYGTLMNVMNTLREAGYLRIALTGVEEGPSR